MTFFGYPRGHRVESETLVLERHGGLTSPVDTLPRTKRLKNPTATAKDDPQDGTDSLSETQLKLLVLNSWRRNFAPFFQTIRVIAAIFRAKVRRAIVGRIPLASKFW